MMTRRELLRAGALAAAGAVCHERRARAQDDGMTSRKPPAYGALRTVTYNVYGCQGWPRTPKNADRPAAARSEIPERLARALVSYAPDVVTLLEAPDKSQVAAMARAADMHFAYHPSEFPGAVLSRHPISASVSRPLKAASAPAADLFTRHFARSVVAAPAGELIVYSAHLHPIRHEIRMREIAAALAAMEDDLRAGAPLLLQGDLNHTPDRPEYVLWQTAGLVDAFAAKGVGPGATSRSDRPARRIDYVWAHGPLASGLTECRVLFEGGFRTPPDDPVGFAWSDHLPVMATFA